MKSLLNIGHMYAGILVEFDPEERLFRVTTDSKGGNNERVVEFNSPEAAAAEVINMASTHALSYKLPRDRHITLSVWLESKANDEG